MRDVLTDLGLPSCSSVNSAALPLLLYIEAVLGFLHSFKFNRIRVFRFTFHEGFIVEFAKENRCYLRFCLAGESDSASLILPPKRKGISQIKD